MKQWVGSGWGPELIPDASILASQFPELPAEMEQKRLRLAELAALFAAADEEDYEDSDESCVLPGEQVSSLKAEIKELSAQWKADLKNLKALIDGLFVEIKAAGKLPPKVKKTYFTEGLTQKTADFTIARRMLELARSSGTNSERVTQIQDAMAAGDSICPGASCGKAPRPPQVSGRRG